MRASLFQLAAIALLACSKATPSPTPEPVASATPGGPIADTPAFRAELRAPGPFKKGEPASFVIRVEAKAPYHVNDEYPAKFKVSDPGADAGAGVSVKYAEPKLERNKHADAFTTEPCAASSKDACVLNITVRFTPEASGAVHVGGTVDIGVCNKDQCLIEKTPLDVSVTVS